jgi:hypothetical protein
MKKRYALLIAAASILTASCASMVAKTETRSYMVKIDVDGETVQPKALADDLKDVLARRAGNMNVDMRFMPEVIPPAPAGGITMKPMNFGPMSVVFMQCHEASIATISNSRTSYNGMGQADGESYTACIFPFAPEGQGKKFRLVIGLRYMESSSGGISGIVAAGVNKAFAAGMGKEEMGQVFFQQVEDGLKARYPSAVTVDKQSL